MAIYKPRTTGPAANNKYYIHYSKGGYNTCKIINKSTGSCLPNCTAYAQGRMLENTNCNKVNWKLPAGYAEDWFETAKKNGLQTGLTPKLGATICWKQGKTHNTKDGCGHVAEVIEIKSNGDIKCGQSADGGKTFYITTVTKSSGYSYNGKQFQGFIYCGVEFETKPTFIVGKTYTCQAEMKVRTGAGVNYSAKKHTQLTTDGQKHDKDKDGCLDKGTVVTCLESKVVGNDVWVRTPSGWVAGYYNNTQYLK